MTPNFRTLGTLGICCLLVPFARAQQPSISEIQITPGGITVVLSTAVASGPDSCLVVNTAQNQTLKLPCKPAQQNAGFVLITQDSSNPFDPQGTYSVILTNVLFAGSKKQVAQVVGTYQAQTKKPPSTKGPSCFVSGFQKLFSGEFQAAEGSTDSNIYFSGQTTHSAGGDFAGTYNLKADLSGLCQTGTHIYRVGPSINLAGGNDPNGSPDSLNFSWLWDARIFKISSDKRTGPEKKETSVHLTQTATLESTQDFLQKDFVYTGDFQSVLTKIWFGGKVRTHFIPDLGTEAGKNLRGVLPQIDGRAIARMKTGADWFLIFDLHKPWLQDISFETTWARRWPLIAEVTYKANKTPPTFSAVRVGTAPRDYIKEAFNLDVTKYIGFTVAYEYGSLPPKFAFLDSKFTIGLTVKAKFK